MLDMVLDCICMTRSLNKLIGSVFRYLSVCDALDVVLDCICMTRSFNKLIGSVFRYLTVCLEICTE